MKRVTFVCFLTQPFVHMPCLHFVVDWRLDATRAGGWGLQRGADVSDALPAQGRYHADTGHSGHDPQVR